MANRSRGTYDIVLDGGDVLLGFNLAREAGRPAVVTSEMSPARLDQQAQNADVPRVIDNLDGGMGFSRRVEAVPNGYSHCLPGYTRAPSGIFCPPGKVIEIPLPASPATWTASPIISSDFFIDRVVLVNQSRFVLEVAPNGSTVSVAATMGPSFTGWGGAVFNNRYYLAGASGGLAYKDGTTAAWVPPSGGALSVFRRRLTTVTWRPQGVPTQMLLGISPDFADSGVRWCPITADPLVDGNWSSPVAVGNDRRFFINEIVAAPQHAYFLRADGIYDMDELGARAFNIAPWMGEGIDQNNGLWGMVVGSDVYYGHSQGLVVVPTTGEAQYAPQWAHPGWGLPHESPVRGHPVAGTLHDGWRIVALYDGTQSYIMAGIPSQDAYGHATHVWHGPEAILPGRVTHMKVHTFPSASSWPRLLIATWDGTAPPNATVRLFWQSIPKGATPIYEMLYSGQFQPADAASLFLPADAWGHPSAVSTLLGVDLVTERVSLTDTIKVWASADAGPWAEQGTADYGSYTSLAPLELTEGRFITTRVDLSGHPILRSIELRAALGIQLREARVYRVILAQDNGLKTPRGREHRDPQMKLIDLQAMLGRVVTLHDEVPMRVRVLQVLAPERRQLSSPTRAGAWALVCPILVSILDHAFRYDGADRYDTDRTWS